MILEVLGISMLLGLLLGGKFGRLADVKIRYGWLIFVAAGFRLGVYFFPSDDLIWLRSGMHIAKEVAWILFVVANMRIPGIKLATFGMCLNLIAIIANGGMMPGTKSAVGAAFGEDFLKKQSDQGYVHTTIEFSECKLGYLCDIIPARKPYALMPAVYSIGDVLLSLGISFAIFSIMCDRLPKKKLVEQET